MIAGPARRRLALLAVALLCGAGWWLWSAWQQAQAVPVVARYRVPLAGLAAPLTIAQLSDSHVGRDMPPARVADAVARINALRPDVIVLTGDYVSGNPDAWSLARTQAALAPLLALRAPLGVFAVTGNHDDPRRLRRLLAGTGVRFLHDASADIGPLILVGAREFSELGRPVETMRALVRRLPPGRPMVLVAHRPDFFPWLPPRIGLLIAGHSHGGQILIPGVTRWLVGGFVGDHLRGRFDAHGQTLLVSSGLGTTAVPLRWGVPPEVVLIRLVPAQAVGRKSGTDRYRSPVS